MLVGLIVLLPAILGYTYWSYSVFKGKVAAERVSLAVPLKTEANRRRRWRFAFDLRV